MSTDLIFTGRNEVLAKAIFSEACVILSTGGGGGVSAPNFRGGCLLQIFGGGVSAANFHGGGCLLQIFGGGLVPGGGSPIFGIRSTFGRYASYWNAFLLFYNVVQLDHLVLFTMEFLPGKIPMTCRLQH